MEKEEERIKKRKYWCKK